MAVNVLGHHTDRGKTLASLLLPVTRHPSYRCCLQFHSQQNPESDICIPASHRKESFLSLLSAQSSSNYVQPQKCHFIYQKAIFQFLNGFGPATSLSNPDKKSTCHSPWTGLVAIPHDRHAVNTTNVFRMVP